VILGRIQEGKGQKLLLETLPRLQSHAQVYLVGTGKSGEAFYGIPGVNVILDYQRDDLPALLSQIGPDVAALLSLVPETFSYTLSELHYLGIPVIATKVGSFPGRIKEGENGWLINPVTHELVQLVEHLWQDRTDLKKVRDVLIEQDYNDIKAMVQAYKALSKPSPRKPEPQSSRPSLAEIQASALAFQDANERKAMQKAIAEKKELQKEVRKRSDWAIDTKRELKEEQERRKHWVGQLESNIENLENEITVQQDYLATTRRDLEQKNLRLKQTNQDLDQLQSLHDQILASSSWRVTRPFRVLRRTGQNFLRSRAWSPLRWPLLISGVVRNLSTLGLKGTLMRLQFGGYQEPPPPIPVELVRVSESAEPPESVPYAETPMVSIIIPAFNNWAYTAACLKSISNARDALGIEVILVDDESSDETQSYASNIRGLRYLRNKKNAGFIESCNNGAAEAKGKYLVLLNNDTQVLDGWLNGLLDVFEMFPDAGLVGSRLIYPDGTLQECGGIVFNDGSGWNYGKGDNPERTEYMYVRDADYCSGACIMIETALFRELGGLDERYKPAYYEDTDLAFKVRESGRRVLVQPASTVIHHEGVTSGTDTDSGIKRYQVVNQETFAKRWQTELASYPSRIEDPTNPANIRAARDSHLRGRVLIIDATTPEPDQDSGSLRLTHVMRCFRAMGFGVTFFADNHMHNGIYTRQL
jgi:GT2 family glycosyltransferase